MWIDLVKHLLSSGSVVKSAQSVTGYTDPAFQQQVGRILPSISPRFTDEDGKKLNQTSNNPYRKVRSDPRYFNILVGGCAEAGKTPLTGAFEMPFGSLFNGKNYKVLRHNDRKGIIESIALAKKIGLKPRVIGHSWGGATVGTMAGNYPDVDFVALDPVSRFDRPEKTSKNLTIFIPDEGDIPNKDGFLAHWAPVVGGRWMNNIPGDAKYVKYKGDHISGVADAISRYLYEKRKKEESKGPIIKSSQSFSEDGSTFTLRTGHTPTHAARAWNNAHPDRRISVRDILAANPGVDARRYIAGVSYRMPASVNAQNNSDGRAQVTNAVQQTSQPTDRAVSERAEYPGNRNNPGNMRHYGQNWLGEESQGLSQGDFLRFDSPTNGLRAAARLIRGTLRRSANPTISSIVPIYSPTNENDVATHTENISRISGLDRNQRLDINNTGQMVDLLHGVVGAESGQPSWDWFTPREQTNAVIRARTSL